MYFLLLEIFNVAIKRNNFPTLENRTLQKLAKKIAIVIRSGWQTRCFKFGQTFVRFIKLYASVTSLFINSRNWLPLWRQTFSQLPENESKIIHCPMLSLRRRKVKNSNHPKFCVILLYLKYFKLSTRRTGLCNGFKKETIPYINFLLNDFF